ncbi:cytochrome c biogenesis CcdA family protein [Micrococcoides hystricis]|uniref:Cytochrome c biogenesis CcdA family protein n=1 Tax=Micrococcoides hystricis TaxID=1572761 RepID=A0ABV6PCQ0_9MICC
MDAGYFVALIGGMLSIFSPCSALLLPSFFAYTATSRGKLSLMGTAFFVGLLVTMVPLGMGVAWVGNALPLTQQEMMRASGWLIIVLGLVQIFGGGFDLGRFLPWRDKAQTHQAGPMVGSFLLGTVSGVAGFCTGPILGAILTFVMNSSSVWAGAAMMAVYSLGLMLPVLVLAAFWRKLSPTFLAKLRGKTFSVGKLQLNTAALIIGLVFVSVGVLMVLTDGFLTAPELISTASIQSIWTWASGVESALPGWLMPTVLTLAALAVWFWFTARYSKADDDEADADDDAQDSVAADHRS